MKASKRFNNLKKKRFGNLTKMIAMLMAVVIAVAVIPTMATPVKGAEVTMIFAPDNPAGYEPEALPASYGEAGPGLLESMTVTPATGAALTFAADNFPAAYAANTGDTDVVFYMNVTASEQATLFWYQGGNRREDMGSVTIEVHQFSMPIRAELRFDTIWATDGGVWTLRGFYDGTQFVESPYGLDLDITPIDIMPLSGETVIVSHDGNTAGGLRWAAARATPTNPVTAALTGSFTLNTETLIPPNSTFSIVSNIGGLHTITAGTDEIVLNGGATLHILDVILDFGGSGGFINATSGTVDVFGATIITHNSADLTAAIALIGNGTGTIRLGASFTHNAGIVISGGANITFDLNGYNLSVSNASSHGMQVSGANTEVNIIGTGIMSVHASSTINADNGLNATGGASVTLAPGTATTGTRLNVSAALGDGVLAGGTDTNVVVTNATGGNSANLAISGARATGGASIVVRGNAQGHSRGVAADGFLATSSTSTVHVMGNVTANGVGAAAITGGVVSIDGTITAANFASVGSAAGSRTPLDFTTPSLAQNGNFVFTVGQSTLNVRANHGANINLATAVPANEARFGAGWVFHDGVYTIVNGANVTVTGANANQRRVTVAANATADITLQGATITGLATDQTPLWLADPATANITLVGTNTLTGGLNMPGLGAGTGRNLTISGTGTLNATGGANGAGIGGSDGQGGGIINITGGTINAAVGAGDGAGIGGGAGTTASGSITISSAATVTVNRSATGHANRNSIGAGVDTAGVSGAVGTINIAAGAVTVNGPVSGHTSAQLINIRTLRKLASHHIQC